MFFALDVYSVQFSFIKPVVFSSYHSDSDDDFVGDDWTRKGKEKLVPYSDSSDDNVSIVVEVSDDDTKVKAIWYSLSINPITRV